MRGILTQALAALILVAGAMAGSPSKETPTKAQIRTAANSAQRPAIAAGTKTRTTRHAAPYQIGDASWYGSYFHGKETASGERYDMYQLTAAHRTLPLGTWVKVTNLRNNRWILVRINDRGPVPKSRIIDLSYAAAQLLDLKAYGVQRVRLDLVNPKSPAETLALAENPIAF